LWHHRGAGEIVFLPRDGIRKCAGDITGKVFETFHGQAALGDGLLQTLAHLPCRAHQVFTSPARRFRKRIVCSTQRAVLNLG
jgi:hypothetical protein